MTWKNALYALFAVVLMGSVAGAALADYSDRDLYEPSDASLSADPERNLLQQDAGEIREPMETGAVPGRMEKSSFPSIYANDPAYSGDPTFWPGGP
jgi:hypothetical protein